nr:putative ribonuclease H-like domain-containing protein [Tanacetum cinerariifolium]
MQKNLVIIEKYFKKIYKPTNNNLRTSLNARNKNVDTSLRETVSCQVVQQTGIQCFNCKEFGHFAKECRKPKRVKDSTYHKEKMLLCKQAEKRELVDQAWEKHSHDHFLAPTAHDMEILIKTCLMPFPLKTHNDSFTFVHELKQEMHANLKYVESLEKETDKLEYDKAEFLNMYDMLLQECLNHNLFSAGQLCDADLEVTFWKSTCFVRDLQGNDLLIGNSSINKSSSPTKNSKQQDTQPTTNIQSSTEPTTPTTNVYAEERNYNQEEDTHVQQDEFVNPFYTSVREVAESFSHNIDNSTEPKNIKEAMADSAWIKAMQEELHQFN